MNKKHILLLLFALGLLLTLLTDGVVYRARARRIEPAASGAAAAAEASGGGPGDGESAAEARAKGGSLVYGKVESSAGVMGPTAHTEEGGSRYDEFLKKFQDTENTLLEISRRNSRGRTGAEQKQEASAQLRYWETQLNALYQTIMSYLTDEEAAVLAREQQDWRRAREEKAAGATKNSAGSPKESTEYMLSQAESTKERAYALLERYRDKLR